MSARRNHALVEAAVDRAKRRLSAAARESLKRATERVGRALRGNPLFDPCVETPMGRRLALKRRCALCGGWVRPQDARRVCPSSPNGRTSHSLVGPARRVKP